MMYRKLLSGPSAVALCLTALVLTAFGLLRLAQGEDAPPKDLALRVAIAGRPHSLFPHQGRRVEAIVTDHVFDQLLEPDPRNPAKFQPALATSWRVSPDHRTLELTLRRDVTWHDGKPLTAHDVRFTFDFVCAPKRRAPIGAMLVQCEAACEVLDTHRVRFTFGKPHAGIFGQLVGSQFKILPKHCLEKADTNTLATFGRHPIGSGAYRFKRWDGNRVQLERNDAWWGRAPFFSTVTFKLYTERAAIVSDLKSGAVDFVARLKDASFFDDLAPHADRKRIRSAIDQDGWTVLRDATKARLRFGAYASGHVQYVAWNCRRGPTADPSVRLALAYLLDRRSLADRSAARPTTSFRPPLSAGYDRNLKPVGFDPKRAKAILRAQRWIDRDRDGILDRDGQRLSIRLVAPQGSNVTNLEQLAAAARTIGVDVTVDVVPKSRYPQVIKSRAFDGIYAAMMITADQDPHPLWHSEGPYNLSGYDAVDELVAEIRKTADPDARARLLRDLHGRVHQAQPILFIDAVTQLAAWSKRLEGVRFYPLKPYGWNLLEWSARAQ